MISHNEKVFSLPKLFSDTAFFALEVTNDSYTYSENFSSCAFTS